MADYIKQQLIFCLILLLLFVIINPNNYHAKQLPLTNREEARLLRLIEKIFNLKNYDDDEIDISYPDSNRGHLTNYNSETEMDISYPDSNRGHLTNYNSETSSKDNNKKMYPDSRYGDLAVSNPDCTSPLDEGIGSNQTDRWFCGNSFCRRFVYNGFGGNANNFASEWHCRYNCQNVCPLSPR
ncbi:tissue factor pathway inhibitor-like [Oppia nitens]|uniref:tissue factor pathway inhibitor-like n=1 Tax=Oppia nitens TaxID=1686743 RepID=UPI0023D9DF31|nr:tissue factor pathway inhibitor-like [Oppia nitens]